MAGLMGETVVIGEFEYQYSLLPVEKGHPLRWELIGLLGESLVGALASAVSSGSIGDAKVETLLQGLSGLFSRLNPAFVWKLQNEMVALTRYRRLGVDEYQPLGRSWQVHFQGRYHELDQLTWAQLRKNYLGFLDDSDGWPALLRAGQQVLSVGRSQSSSSRTGTSGESSAASASAPA